VDEVDLSFVFDDGRRLTIPVTTVFRASGKLIDECRMTFYPEPSLELAAGEDKGTMTRTLASEGVPVGPAAR